MRAVAGISGVDGIPITSSAAPTPDLELVKIARSGNHPAFEELVRRYSERAYRAAYRVVCDPHQAEEIVQEGLIKAYRGLRKFEGRASFYTWLYRIVVNLALDLPPALAVDEVGGHGWWSLEGVSLCALCALCALSLLRRGPRAFVGEIFAADEEDDHDHDGSHDHEHDHDDHCCPHCQSNT